MPSVKVHLTFPNEIVKRPIIYEIGHEFKVVTNIRRANVAETTGWVDLEITGESEEIEKALESLKKIGVRIDPIEGNVIE
ncbi:MAG TPA: NIL domain-containing protein [Nitrospinota bacterium]|nr:NIL domain-containing protein [Nitrospinota bacterium]